MEKKTIGNFLSALRKANGLTQRQLAEMLNVSDKAISRWERDETMPDITLIPVLAEIFGVTSDEILRAERQVPEKQSATAETRTEKQRKYLIAERHTKFKVRSILSIGIGALGLITAMIINLGFLRAYLGFLFGCVFYTTAIVLQIVFATLHLSGIDEELLGNTALAQYRLKNYLTTMRVIRALIMMLAASLPLILIPSDPYWGLNAGTWLLYGLLGGVISLIVTAIINWGLQLQLSGRGYLLITSTKIRQYKLRLRLSGILTITLVALFVIQCLLNALPVSCWSPGTQFNNWSDFKKLMETPADDMTLSGEDMSVAVPVVPDDTLVEDYYPAEQIIDDRGNVLCEFINRNHSVKSWTYTQGDNELIIKIYTIEDFNQANQILDKIINPIFIILYLVSAVMIFVHYRKKVKIM